ncbi:DUF4132 domain-containing protein [Pseudahrensia aquimaris]|uniref:DUF4132 domain-containing protein n=1 Tax=Pseudahrensia aquimaris TaxID=744461 RepID=A0ABW3FIU6_9HYPH
MFGRFSKGTSVFQRLNKLSIIDPDKGTGIELVDAMLKDMPAQVAQPSLDWGEERRVLLNELRNRFHTRWSATIEQSAPEIRGQIFWLLSLLSFREYSQGLEPPPPRIDAADIIIQSLNSQWHRNTYLRLTQHDARFLLQTKEMRALTAPNEFAPHELPKSGEPLIGIAALLICSFEAPVDKGLQKAINSLAKPGQSFQWQYSDEGRENIEKLVRLTGEDPSNHPWVQAWMRNVEGIKETAKSLQSAAHSSTLRPIFDKVVDYIDGETRNQPATENAYDELKEQFIQLAPAEKGTTLCEVIRLVAVIEAQRKKGNLNNHTARYAEFDLLRGIIRFLEDKYFFCRQCRRKISFSADEAVEISRRIVRTHPSGKRSVLEAGLNRTALKKLAKALPRDDDDLRHFICHDVTTEDHKILADAFLTDEDLRAENDERVQKSKSKQGRIEIFEQDLKSMKVGARPAKKDIALFQAFITEETQPYILENLSLIHEDVKSLQTENLHERIVRIGTGKMSYSPLIWASSFLPSDTVAPSLADIAMDCYKPKPGKGLTNERAGNACLWALGNLPKGAGAPYLARILARTKYPKVRKLLEATLTATAHAAGISRADLDETIVPDHGLLSAKALPDFAQGRCELTFADGKAKLSWFNADGKPLKAPNAAIKDKDSGAIKRARMVVKEANIDLLTQSRRIEGLYLQERVLAAKDWQTRYNDHETVGVLSRRLVWRAQGEAGQRTFLAPDGNAIDPDGNAIDLTDTKISLWHPTMSSADEIAAWRERIVADEIIQPFRQVFRETYELTDAERETQTYTNRFAGHVLKQHQTIALARDNGWACSHRTVFDTPDDEPMRILLPAHGLQAEFWNQGFGGKQGPALDSGSLKFLSTDRLQFHKLDPDARFNRGEKVALEDLPPMIFSEMLRHCDLFTSVASIATDPEWEDRGDDAQHPDAWAAIANEYWQRAVSADLGTSAKMRRDVIEMVLPKLTSLSKVCSIEGNVLTVTGKKHNYAIHIGSGAVCLMPQRRHICIVPAGLPSTNTIYLPFTGDTTLSLILSKARLLADDDKITDPVILGQI